jgi:hypothetical protein
MARRASRLAGLFAVTLTGCAVPMGRLAVIAPHGGTPPATTVRVVEGEDCAAAAMGSSGAVPSLQRAVERALAQAPGANALVDVAVTNVRGGVPVLYVTNCLTVKGRAVTVGRGGTP